MPSAGSWIASDSARTLVWDFRQQVRSTAARPRHEGAGHQEPGHQEPGHEAAAHRQGMECPGKLWLALRTTSPMLCPGVLWI